MNQLMSYQKYIIAPKRAFRSSVQPDWQESLKQIQGIQVIGQQPVRIQVQATPEAMDEARSLLGDMYYIEQSIPHRKSRKIRY